MSGLARPSALAPFRIRNYRFQWPADLLTSWAFEMETLILGWSVLVEDGAVWAWRAGRDAHSTRATDRGDQHFANHDGYRAHRGCAERRRIVRGARDGGGVFGDLPPLYSQPA